MFLVLVLGLVRLLGVFLFLLGFGSFGRFWFCVFRVGFGRGFFIVGLGVVLEK